MVPKVDRGCPAVLMGGNIEPDMLHRADRRWRSDWPHRRVARPPSRPSCRRLPHRQRRPAPTRCLPAAHGERAQAAYGAKPRQGAYGERGGGRLSGSQESVGRGLELQAEATPERVRVPLPDGLFLDRTSDAGTNGAMRWFPPLGPLLAIVASAVQASSQPSPPTAAAAPGAPDAAALAAPDDAALPHA